MSDRERAIFWEEQTKKSEQEARYYQQQLVDAHALLGRIVHQFSERWDQVNLTKSYPTDNLFCKKTIDNPKGE